MFVPSNWACQYLLVFISFKQLLVETRATASDASGEYTAESYINSSSRDLSVTESHQSFVISGVSTTKQLSSTLSTNNFTGSFYSKSSTSYKSITEVIETTATVRNTTTASTNGTSAYGVRDAVSISQAPQIQSTETPRTISRVSSTVGKTNTSITGTAVPVLVSYESNNDTSSNVTAAYSVRITASPAAGAIAKLNISETISNYAMINSSAEHPKPNQTASPHSKIRWTKTVTSSYSAYEGSINSHRNNYTSQVPPSIAPSPQLSTSIAVFQSKNRSMPNISETNFNQSSGMFKENATLSVESIRVTTASDIEHINNSSTISNNSFKRTIFATKASPKGSNSSETFPSYSNIWKTEVSAVNTSLYEEIKSIRASQAAFGTTKIWNVNSTTSVMFPRRVTERNSSGHIEVYSTNVSLNILPRETKTHSGINSISEEEVPSSVLQSPSLVASNLWRVNSTRHFPTVLQASLSDVFETRTNATHGVVASVSYSYSMNETTRVYPTPALATSAPFSEGSIENSTISLLSHKEQTVTRIFSKSSPSLPEEMSDAISNKNTTQVFDVRFSTSLHNSTHTQLNPSFTEEGRTPGEKSQSFWMSSLVKNVSRNTLVFSQTSPEHQTFKSSVSPEITYTSSNIRNLSKPFSSNLLSLSASSLQTSAKHSTYQTSKSLLEVNSSYTTVETNPKTVTDIWPVINSSTPISQSRLSNISSDSMHPTLPNVTLKPSTADVKTSNGLPVLTSPPQINRTTVFPVYTPCYISYVVTVSRRIKQFSPSTDDIKWSRTAVEHQSSRSNDSLPSGTAQLHPTPSTRFSTEFRTTEKHSKKENFPTRSLSRLPDRIESSVQSGHAPTAAMTSTYSTLANETISSGSRNVSYSNAMISNLTVSSLVSNELSANTNFTANIQSHSTPTSNSTQDSSPLLTPARNSSLTPSGKLFSTVNVSRSISKHGKFNLSNETRTVYTAFLSSSQKISSIHINGSTVLRSFVTESLAKNVTYVRYTNGILSTTTYPSFSLKSAFVSIEEISMTTNDTSSLLGHIAQTKTLNSSTLEDESPSTFSSKAVYGTVLQPIKSSHSFFSVSNADQNITTSPDVQAAASTDSIFSTKINQTTTPYHYAGYTSVNYLPSSYSRKSTSQPAVGMTIGGTSTVIGRKTNTSYLGLSTEGQNSVQPTPVLLRTPTINNSSFTLSSPVLGIMYSKEVRSHRSNRSESIFPSVSVLNAIKSSTPSSGGSDESVLDKTSPLSSSLSWKTTRDNSSYFTPNKTDFMTSSLHELSQQNSTIHITINKTATNAAYFTSTKNFDLSSIKPTKVIASIMTDSVAPNLNSALEMTMSSSASLSTTVVLKQSEGGWNAPLRRKRRQVLNANITKPANLSTFYITSPKLEMGESSEGIITPISSLLPTLQAVLSPNFSIRATKVLPRPSLIQTWSTEKVSRAHSRNLSRSRSAEESKSISEDFNSSIIPLPTSSEGAVHSSASLVRPEHTSTILTSGARFVHSSPYSNSSSRRSFGTNSSIHDTSPLRGTVSVNKSSLFNHNSFRTESNYSISATATQKQNMIVTSNYSNTARHSIVLLPSSTKDTVKVVIKPSVSSLLAESNSTSSKVDVINSSSIINTTSQKLITFSNFTITPSITRRKNETRILVSEPRLNISLSTSNGSKISSPEIRNSSYASSMYNSFSFKPTTSTHQQGHNTVFNLPESSLNTIVMKSRSIASTTSKAYEQTLRTMLPLYTVRSANMNISTVDGSAQEKSTFSVSSLSPKSSLEHLSTATKNMKEKHSAITPKNISDHSRLSFTYSTEIPHSPTTGQQQSSRLDINISEDLTSSVDKLLPLRTASHSGLSLQANTSSGSSSLTHIYSKESMNVTETSTANLTSSIEELVSKSIQNLSLKAATYSHTSSVIGNISRASYTVRTAYLPMTTSPSPSFSFIGSKTITATPMLPDRSDTSSHSILNQTFSLPNSHSNLEQTTDVVDSFSSTSSSASHTEQNSTLPTVMESVSSHEGATTGGIDAVGYFTHYIIPTSSLGLCLAGYSTTIFLNVSFHYSATSTIPANLTASSTFASASVELYANVTSTELQYSSVNQTSTVMRPLQRSSVTVNMINISSSNPINSSVASSSLLRSAQSSLNASSRPKVTVFTNVPMKHTILSSVLLNTTITVSSSSIVSQPTSTYAGSSILHSMRSSITDIPKASTVTTTNTSLTSGKIQVSPSTSSIVQSSSAAITLAPTTSVKMLIIVIKVPENTNINTVGFKANIEDKLYEVYWIGKLIENAKRPKRRSIPDSRVEVKNMQRDGEEVDIRYIVIANNRTMPAKAAAKTMDSISIKRMSEIIEYDVISRPKSVPSIDPKSQVVVILVETISQKNLSNPVTRSSFENELASFYKTSKKVSNVHTVEATLTKLFFEPLGRTYIEYFITVDNITVDRTKVLVAFNVSVNELSNSLKQTVLVAPYIPSVLQLSEMDYIIQTMEFKSVSDLNAIEQEIANKLTQVYIKARLKTSRKRKKRALGSIDAVVTKTKKTQGESADVTYYISDAGSILNATYACAILNKLTIHEMSSVTTPYTVTSTPRPLTPTTSGASDKDDEHPSWFIPVIIAGSLGFLLLIIVIILYCRWKKGAPPKKVQPQANEEEVHKPRMTHASEPEGRSALRHPPSLTTRAGVAVEENGHSETRPKPAPRRLPVRENSVRRKVPSRESVSTRTNPAYVEEESDDETLTDMSVNQSRIQETNVVVGRRTQSETPRKTIPPRPLQRTLPSDEEDESEESEDDSQFTPNGGAFAVADRHSAGTLPPVAVMTGGPRHPEIQPPVRFRPSVHPEPSLPPLDQKPTSLVGRVVEEEGSVQKEMRTKADIERWRNKQRQRDKKLGESSKSGNKRPSFTEKKAWGRAQQEIGAVLDPEAMQPIVRKTRRKPRRKYKIRAETSDDEENVELRGFRKLTSPREEKVPNAEHESPSDSDISMGEARRRMIALIDDAFTSIKSASKKHHPETSDQVDAGGQAQSRPQNKQPPPLYPRPTTLTPALPEPPPSHGRASIPSARHRRRFMNSQNSLPYPSQYYPGMSGGYSPRYPPPPPPPVVTKNPLVVWDPVDKQRALNQSAYRPYARTPYSYTDPSGKLHFTPVQQTPDGMGGLVWSPYATEYAMEDFYRNVEMPGTLDPKNSSFLSKMEETTLGESTSAPRETVVEMPQADIAGEPGTRTGEPAEPLVRAIKDELFRLASGRSPVKHM